jgi:secreted Zn-dependent insulinase-like peptidase
MHYEYELKMLSENYILHLNNLPDNLFDFSLDSKYLPEDTNLIFYEHTEKQGFKSPLLVNKDNLHEVWYLKATWLKIPKIVTEIQLVSPNGFKSPWDFSLLSILERILTFYVQNEFDQIFQSS